MNPAPIIVAASALFIMARRSALRLRERLTSHHTPPMNTAAKNMMMIGSISRSSFPMFHHVISPLVVYRFMWNQKFPGLT